MSRSGTPKSKSTFLKYQLFSLLKNNFFLEKFPNLRLIFFLYLVNCMQCVCVCVCVRARMCHTSFECVLHVGCDMCSNEESSPLKCSSVPVGEWYLTFWRIMLPPPSRSGSSRPLAHWQNIIFQKTWILNTIAVGTSHVTCIVLPQIPYSASYEQSFLRTFKWKDITFLLRNTDTNYHCDANLNFLIHFSRDVDQDYQTGTSKILSDVWWREHACYGRGRNWQWGSRLTVRGQVTSESSESEATIWIVQWQHQRNIVQCWTNNTHEVCSQENRRQESSLSLSSSSSESQTAIRTET